MTLQGQLESKLVEASPNPRTAGQLRSMLGDVPNLDDVEQTLDIMVATEPSVIRREVNGTVLYAIRRLE